MEGLNVARPISVYTPERLAEIKQAIEDYTEKTVIPILAEFSYTYGVLRQELYKHPELSDAIKNLMAKKEFQLEKMAMTNKVNSTFAIFSLKQLGWRDKQEIEHKVDKTVLDELREKYENK